MKNLNRRYFYIIDLDCTVVVEPVSTRKEIFEWLDEFLENLPYDWFDSDDTFSILYDDGSEDYISQSDYDGHKIRKQHISSMVYSNDCTYIVYGNFEVNEYGVVTTSKEMIVDNTNIKEMSKEDYTEKATGNNK